MYSKDKMEKRKKNINVQNPKDTGKESGEESVSLTRNGSRALTDSADSCRV